MTDSTQSTGRARGRPRGKPMTEEEARASLRKPGDYPAHIQPPPQQSASGRGRRNRAPEFRVRTKSDQLTTKKGLGGTEDKLASNYFPLIANPNWRLRQYCVDIQPDINMTKVRKDLVGSHETVLPRFVNLQKWVVVFPTEYAAVTTEFINSLKKVGASLGMTVEPPKEFTLTNNKPGTYVQTLDQVLKMMPSIVMVVIPNNKGELYAAIKKKCVIEQPTPSQCITATVLNNPNDLLSVAIKVAVQMNCKLGGDPWSSKLPKSGVMIIGYDTYHDTLHKGKSVGAVVASINQECTKFLSIANIHSNPQQELDDLICPAVSKALRKYQQLNGSLPKRLIMYRDAVGEGQIPYIVNHEVAAIKRSLQKASGEGKELKFTYIIVSKRISTRISKMNAQPSNPLSGTVVDDVVTLPDTYDFFLVSKSVKQGTVNSTSYNVIKDDSGLKPEHIQKLTYKLCQQYYNWPETGRVPAPCQYAHKLAVLVGESLHIAPSDKLEETLYYL